MKKKIVILGSTGSIGKTLLDILYKDKEKFNILLLTANKNHKSLLQQAKKFKVKNLIITNPKSYKILKEKISGSNIKVFNDFEKYKLVFKYKADYVMSAITGIEALKPTIDIVKHTKKIAIANKESIICGWNLIKKEIKKYKTEFVPIDSEHFSIWSLLNNKLDCSNIIEKIFITASGGPFYKYPLDKFSSITPRLALNHPNWNMGKKISIDSSTMMNKVFEVIEAKNIFNLSYKQIYILTHQSSYLHAIVKFNNGIIKLLIHDTSMKIPIFNSIYKNSKKSIKSNDLQVDKLNNLNLQLINQHRFPSIKILKLLPKKHSLFETVILSSNDELVKLFLEGKIKFNEISHLILKIAKKGEFIKYKKISPRNIDEIIKLSKFVRLKTNSLSI